MKLVGSIRRLFQAAASSHHLPSRSVAALSSAFAQPKLTATPFQRPHDTHMRLYSGDIAAPSLKGVDLSRVAELKKLAPGLSWKARSADFTRALNHATPRNFEVAKQFIKIWRATHGTKYTAADGKLVLCEEEQLAMLHDVELLLRHFIVQPLSGHPSARFALDGAAQVAIPIMDQASEALLSEDVAEQIDDERDLVKLMQTLHDKEQELDGNRIDLLEEIRKIDRNHWAFPEYRADQRATKANLNGVQATAHRALRELAYLVAARRIRSSDTSQLDMTEESMLAWRASGEVRTTMKHANFAWPLHRVLAGLDTFGLSDSQVSAVQKQFGWTMSFSRALRGGRKAMEEWFTALGVDVDATSAQYQCESQESEAQRLVDSSLESTALAGVQRMVCRYPRHGHAQLAAAEDIVTTVPTLLLYAPVLQPGLSTDPEAEMVLHDGKQVLLPGVFPQRDAPHPVPSGTKLALQRLPIVLTPPRVQFILRVAEDMPTETSGILLSGADGVGKTMLLKALSTALPVGFPTDMLYLGDPGQAVAHSWKQFAQSSGPLADRTVSEQGMSVPVEEGGLSLADNQRIVGDVWSKAADSMPERPTPVDWYEYFPQPGSMVRGAIDRFFREGHINSYGRLYIFDNFERLARRLDNCYESKEFGFSDEVREGFKRMTRWNALEHSGHERGACGDPCLKQTLRVLTAPPEKLDIVDKDVASQQFYDLRSARSDHLAAVLVCAPHFIKPGVDSRAFDGSAGNDRDMAFVRAKYACEVLCGNLRLVSRYMAAVDVKMKAEGSVIEAMSSGQVTAMHLECLEAVRQSYVTEITDQLLNKLINNDDGDARGAARRLVEASLMVRQQPHKTYSRHEFLVGSTALHALRILFEEGVYHSQRSSVFTAQTASSTRHNGNDTSSLKDEVQKRLAMQALSYRSWRLDQLPKLLDVSALGVDSVHSPIDKSVMVELLASTGIGSSKQVARFFAAARTHTGENWCQFFEDWQESSLPPSVHVVFSSLPGNASIVGEHVPQIARLCWHTGGSVIIRTPDSFPGVDFIVLRNSNDDERIVMFVHCSADAPPFPGADDEVQSDLPPTLRDIARLTREKVHTARDSNGKWWLADGPSDDRQCPSTSGDWETQGKQSIANFWLSVVGCPLRVRADTFKRTVQVGPNTYTKGLRVGTYLAAYASEADGGEDTPEGGDDCDTDEEYTGKEYTGKEYSDEEYTDEEDTDEEYTAEEDTDEEDTGDYYAPQSEVSIVYVNTSPTLPAPGAYMGLRSSMVYGVFQPDLEEAEAQWVK